MLKTLSVFAFAATIAMPAAAQVPASNPPSQSPAASPAVKDSNKMICERQDETGSRLGGSRICKTALQWQQERQQQREMLEAQQRQGK